jgi:hypothetical protein
LLLSSFRSVILSQSTVSFIFQFVYLFSLFFFYGGGSHSSIDVGSRDMTLCRLVCRYQSTWHLSP